MSESVRVVVVGATGLVGQAVIAEAVGHPGLRLTALARREIALPPGARMELLIADPADWPAIIAEIAPNVLIIALGTTWRAAGKSEAAFRAIDQDLVLNSAKAAKTAGATHCIAVSAVGADAASGNFYLRVKGEAEDGLGAIGFARLDILRPGLLRGDRGGDRRALERLAILAAPITDRLLHGQKRRFRSIPGRDVARAALTLIGQAEAGRHVHQHDELQRLSAVAR